MKTTTFALGAMVSLMMFSNLYANDVNCQLNTRLSEKQISLLKKADDISRIGLNKVLLGKDVYRIQIMNNKLTDKLVVFLGETHVKGLRSSIIGKKIVKEFNYRLVEGVPKDEMERIRVKYPELYSGVGWKREMFALLTFNPFSSTIREVMKDGQTVPSSALEVTVKDVEDFNYDLFNVKVLGDFISILNSKVMNFPMEFGGYIEPTKDDNYILNARNVRMASNIALISNAIADKGDQLVVVGYAHLPGLKELLEMKDFESCKLDL